MLADCRVSDVSGLSLEHKAMLMREVKCQYHSSNRQREMIPRNNRGVVSEIPRVNRTTLFQTRSHITKGFHLNDGLSEKSSLKEGKGILPKLSVTSLTKLKSRDFGGFSFPKPLKRGFSTNSFESRLPGKSLMSTAQYYELKKIYGEKPANKLEKIRHKGFVNEKQCSFGSKECERKVKLISTEVSKRLKCTSPQGVPTSPTGKHDEFHGDINCVVNELETRSTVSSEGEGERDNRLQELVDNDDTTNRQLPTPCRKIQLAPLKPRETPSSKQQIAKASSEKQLSDVGSNLEHTLWLYDREPSFSPGIFREYPISALSTHSHLPGLPCHNSTLSVNSQNISCLSPGTSAYPITPAPTRLATGSSLETRNLGSGPKRLCPKPINVGPEIPKDLRIVGNTPRPTGKVRRSIKHIRKTAANSSGEMVKVNSKEKRRQEESGQDLNIKGTQMNHKTNSQMLNYLNYSRDYRVGEVMLKGCSCDRMESHWIANDLQTLSQQKLGLLGVDWMFDDEDEIGNMPPRQAPYPTEKMENTSHVPLLCTTLSKEDLWLRNISMIIACSSCSSTEVESDTSRSTSTSGSVSLSTSTADLLLNPVENKTTDRKEKCNQNNEDKVEDREAICSENRPNEENFAKNEIKTVAVSVIQRNTPTTESPQSFSESPVVLSSCAQPPTTPVSHNSPVYVANRCERLPLVQAIQNESCRTDWHSLNLSQGPLGSIVLKHTTKSQPHEAKYKGDGKTNSSKTMSTTQKKPGKIWRRKKRLHKPDSKSQGDETETENATSSFTGCLPEILSAKWRKSGSLCFTPIYDSRYDQWKRRRGRQKLASQRKKAPKGSGYDIEFMMESSDSEEEGISTGASTTVDPRSSCSSESELDSTDAISSGLLSPVPNETGLSKAKADDVSNEEQSMMETAPRDEDDDLNESLSRRIVETFPVSVSEKKSSKITFSLPSVPEQESNSVNQTPDLMENSEQTGDPLHTELSAKEQTQQENLAKKLKAIIKGKHTSAVEVSDQERTLTKESRVSSAPGLTSVWLTESLAVSSIGPPPSSDIQGSNTRQNQTRKKQEKPEKCSRLEKTPKKTVTLQEILRFLPNIGIKTEEPSEECSHDLTRVLPNGRRPDVTLCQSCVCKMAMAHTATKSSAGVTHSDPVSTGKPETAKTSKTDLETTENQTHPRKILLESSISQENIKPNNKEFVHSPISKSTELSMMAAGRDSQALTKPLVQPSTVSQAGGQRESPTNTSNSNDYKLPAIKQISLQENSEEPDHDPS